MAAPILEMDEHRRRKVNRIVVVVLKRDRVIEARRSIHIVMVGVLAVMAVFVPLVRMVRREDAQVNVRNVIMAGGLETVVTMASARHLRQQNGGQQEQGYDTTIHALFTLRDSSSPSNGSQARP